LGSLACGESIALSPPVFSPLCHSDRESRNRSDLFPVVRPRVQFAHAGNAITVLDGDTIEVLHNNCAERIRLNGIDCPEKGQAYGKKGKQAASELVFGKEGTLRTYGLDKHELLKEGWRWWCGPCTWSCRDDVVPPAPCVVA